LPTFSAEEDYSDDIERIFSLEYQMEKMGLVYDEDSLFDIESQVGYELIKEDISTEHNQERSIFIPFHLDSGDIVKASAAAGAAIVLFSSDEAITKFALEHKTERTQVIADIGERFGAGVDAAALAGGAYVIGVVVKNDKIKSISYMAMKSMILPGLVTRAIKTTLRRKRPKSDEGAHSWGGTLRDHSFPSGHTTLAFSIGTFIAESTKGYSKTLPVLAYAASTIAGVSRVHDEAHWASDVLIGALIGHLVTKNVMRKTPTRSGFRLNTFMNNNGQMLIGLRYHHKEPKKVSDCNKTSNPVRACLREAFNLPME
tara:strand:- start:57228 stop:58169 length:942 start_codon:yes stop_codon:yes gene_type:complete